MHGSNQRKFFKKIYTRISRIGLGFIYVYLKVSCNFGRRKPFNKKKISDGVQKTHLSVAFNMFGNIRRKWKKIREREKGLTY